jgi:serine phosphatase RsbU (regulator of sigma subunit)
MTLISSSILTQALQTLGPRDPAALIAEVSRRVKSMLGQMEGQGGATESDDGMDAAFLWFEPSSRKLSFAGARLALQILPPEPADSDALVQTLDSDRMGVGYVDTPFGFSWTPRTVEVAPGSLLFITTDGLIDQIGGPREIAYGKRRIRDVLLAQRAAPAAQLSQALLDDFQAWQGAQPRRDDLTFFCCRP